MKIFNYKERILQTTLGCIFFAAILTSPVFGEDVFTPKDLLDIKTNAFALYNTGQSERALGLLEGIPQNLRSGEVYTIMANIYEDEGNTNKALETLNKAIAVDPKYYKAYYNFGVIYTKRKSWELAVSNFKLSIKHNPKFPYAYYNLGCCYLELKQWEKAKDAFIKAIALKKDDKDFYKNLAIAYKQLGKEKEAKKVLGVYNSEE